MVGGISLIWAIPTNYPQGNGRIERSFRTDEEGFYQVEDLPTGLGGLGVGSPVLEPHLRDGGALIKPWVTRPRTSSITTGSILMPRDKEDHNLDCTSVWEGGSQNTNLSI